MQLTLSTKFITHLKAEMNYLTNSLSHEMLTAFH